MYAPSIFCVVYELKYIYFKWEKNEFVYLFINKLHGFKHYVNVLRLHCQDIICAVKSHGTNKFYYFVPKISKIREIKIIFQNSKFGCLSPPLRTALLSALLL